MTIEHILLAIASVLLIGMGICFKLLLKTLDLETRKYEHEALLHSNARQNLVLERQHREALRHDFAAAVQQLRLERQDKVTTIKEIKSELVRYLNATRRALVDSGRTGRIHDFGNVLEPREVSQKAHKVSRRRNR